MFRGLPRSTVRHRLSAAVSLARGDTFAPTSAAALAVAGAAAADAGRGSLALYTAVRCQWDANQALPRGLSRVGHQVERDEIEGVCAEGSVLQQEDFDTDPEAMNPITTAACGSAPSHEEKAEEQVIELSDAEAGKLEKLFGRKVSHQSFLTKREREQLVRMIFVEFYRALGQDDEDEAMLYQASLEVAWLEEWVEDLMSGAAQPPPAGPAGTSGKTTVPQTADEARRLIKRAVLERVDLHKPLSYIIGSQPFFGCTIACRAPLLCPRPETEMWTHWFVRECLSRATRETTPIRVLDMCAGTGCIGVAIAKHFARAQVTAVDLLPDATELCEANARRNGLDANRYRALVSDMFDVFATSGGNRSSAAPVATEASAYPRMPSSTAERDASTQEQRGQDAAGAKSEAEPAPVEDDSAENRKESRANTSTSSSVKLRFRQPVNLPTRPKTVIAPEHVGTFDVLVANPPYVLPEQYVALPRNITHWESKMALVGDDYRETRQYLYYQELCECGAKLLKPRVNRDPRLRHVPNVVIEVGLQARMIASLMEQTGLFDDVEVHLDYANQERWITANTNH